MHFECKHIVTAILFIAVVVSGHSQTQPASGISPLIYEVQSGDTLTKIAKRFGLEVKAIVQSNHLPNAKLLVGQKLIIPPPGELNAALTGTSTPGTSLQTNSTANMSGQTSPSEHTWLQSSSHEVELGLCDKNGDGDFSPLFVVTGPDGEDHKAPPKITDQKRKSGIENYASAYVTFPTDFNTYWKEGKYSWKCFVESNCVASGSFEYRYVSNSISVIVNY